MARITLTVGGQHHALHSSVHAECLTLLSGEGAKAGFSYNDAAEQMAVLLDIEIEDNGWTQVVITFTGVEEICELLEGKLRDLGIASFSLYTSLKAVC